jgi:threonylcarbamoyladenosine tRNA methylthiotransferase MtaB
VKISYYSIGCKVNYAEISSIVQKFLDNGAELVPFGEDCDLILINSCTVTHLADSDSRKIIRRAKRKAPNAKIAAMGCYAQMQSEKIAEIEGVDYIFGNKEKFEIFDLIQNDLKNGFRTKNKDVQIFVSNLSNSPFYPAFSSDNESHSRIVFKIQDGCDYHCSYCTVAAARGPSRSMNFDEIEKTIRNIEEKGYKEIVLSGINLGDYKSNDGNRFIDLLKMIDATDFNTRFRISSIEPNLLTEEIIELVGNSKKFCPHFHIPLQSGSDRVLNKMRRRYSKSLFESRVELIKKHIPDCCIGVDIICGFPNESAEDFDETYSLLKMLPISYLHTFTYSERAGTDAIKLKPKVQYEEKKRRTLTLRELSEIKKIEFYKSQLEKIKKVIPEEYDEITSHCKGWTENYVRVKFFCEKELESQVVSVKLDFLQGDLVFGKIANSSEY